MKIDGWLLEILACPQCHAPLRADDEASELVCTNPDCGLAYPVRDDIPVLLIDEARRPGERASRPSAPAGPAAESGPAAEPGPAAPGGPAAEGS
jgi:uncharacterized protein YbaR (Trm112 family)